MKICVAQTRPVKGDIKSNMANHIKLAGLAASYGADIIIFSELSLTGYEPSLAKELAVNEDDNMFDGLQQLSNNKHITIGAGMPIKGGAGVMIGMLIFQPHKPRQTYFKQYLHADEEPYFISGPCRAPLAESKIALAICYELSVPAHIEQAHKNSAEIYLTSVAKSVTGVEKAVNTLAGIAAAYSMMVLMANCVGYCDNFDCGGKTSVWNNKGVLAAQLDDASEGILIVDIATQQIIEKTL